MVLVLVLLLVLVLVLVLVLGCASRGAVAVSSKGNEVGAALMMEKLLLAIPLPSPPSCRGSICTISPSPSGGSTASFGTHGVIRFRSRCPWTSHFEVSSTIGPQMVTHMRGMSSGGRTSAVTMATRPERAACPSQDNLISTTSRLLSRSA